jgi:hypothetical protein
LLYLFKIKPLQKLKHVMNAIYFFFLKIKKKFKILILLHVSIFTVEAQFLMLYDKNFIFKIS